jgi:NADH:ubiquinone reductase (H+-translocating)
MTIATEDVRRLLAAGSDAMLVLLEGRTEVIDAAEADDDAHRGALQIISRADLLERTGGNAEPSKHELAEQAAALDAAVSELGG